METNKDINIEQLDNDNKNPDEVKENKFLKFILARKYYVVLVLIILIITGWALIKIGLLNKSFQDEKSVLINTYEMKLDSLNINRMQLTAKTFSWAIRSELMRENKEQINQFFSDFIKIPEIIKLQFINSETSVVEISTDKKDEGIVVPNYININEQLISSDSTKFTIATPITGLNKRIGIFVISVKKL